MDENEFRRLLTIGLGRAVLYARENDVHAYRDLILDACTNCYALDPQIEGTRADFMFDLVNSLPDYEFFRQRILASLQSSDDDWSAKQRYRIAGRMAQSGDEEAKRIMYDSFAPGPSFGGAIGVEFMNLDGMDGLLFAAEKLGEARTRSPKNFDLGWLASCANDSLGEKEVKEALSKASERNEFIAAYFSEEEKFETALKLKTTSNSQQAESYEALKPRLPAKWPSSLKHWGKRVQDEELLKAANGLLSATDSEMQKSHLAIFSQRRFPLDHRILLKFANSSDEKIQWSAINALAQINHPDVRALAIHLIQTNSRCRELSIKLLTHNFQSGDHEMILGWFEAEEDLETLHTESRGLLSFWSANPSEELHNRMLLSLYEKCPCSFCREDAVSTLIERSALPQRLRIECAFDANTDIRDLVILDHTKLKPTAMNPGRFGPEE